MFIVNYVLLYVLMKSWCKLPEDGDYAETCKNQVIERIIECRIVHFCVTKILRFSLNLRSKNFQYVIICV